MFTQSCYIKKNTKELREKLKSLGYKLNHGKAWGKYLACFKTEDTNEYVFVGTTESDLENMPNFAEAIDCRENEGLFLTIAALRDDTDINQWFTDGEMWKYSVFEHFTMDAWYARFGNLINNLHKATVEELIKRFSGPKSHSMWVARYSNSSLYMFYNKPIKYRNMSYVDEVRDEIYLDEDWFPEVTFENSPVEVEVKIK